MAAVHRLRGGSQAIGLGHWAGDSEGRQRVVPGKKATPSAPGSIALGEASGAHCEGYIYLLIFGPGAVYDSSYLPLRHPPSLTCPPQPWRRRKLRRTELFLELAAPKSATRF